MADKTAIEWTDATWNPVVGCSVVSPGCTNCYAMRFAGARLDGNPKAAHYAGTTARSKSGPVWTGRVALAPDHIIAAPLRWRRPRRIFVNSMGDLFHEAVPRDWIDQAFAVMALAPRHVFQVLTKRSARMLAYVSDPSARRRIYEIACDMTIDLGLDVILIAPGIDERMAPAGPRVRLGVWPLPNVWLGVSAEDQQRADGRVPDLLATPAALRFVSAEPLLGPIDFHDGFIRAVNRFAPAIDWLIVGGESGAGARPMHPDWVRSIRAQCAAAGVPFFFKQWGEWSFDSAVYERDADDPDRRRVGKRRAGRTLDGREHDAMPAMPKLS